MGRRVKEEVLIILIVTGILLASCASPPAKTSSDDKAPDPTTVGVENPVLLTASPTIEIIRADIGTPVPVTETPIQPTSTPIPQIDTPTPAGETPTQVTLIPRDQAIVTQEPSVTPTLQPVENPDNSALLDSLQNQLVFAVGGGGGPLTAQECNLAVQEYSGPLPAVVLGKRHQFAERIGSICLVGLDLEGTLYITISDINGTVLGNATYDLTGETVVLGEPREEISYLDQTNPVGNTWDGILSRQAGSPGIVQLNIWLPTARFHR